MPGQDCLFCKIIAGEIDADVRHRDPLCVAIRDVNPQAPVHLLVLPVKHVATTNDLLPEDEPLAGHMLTVAAQLAAAEGIAESGYRCVLNCNRGAGQSVFHLHLHVLGGRSLGWPPG